MKRIISIILILLVGGCTGSAAVFCDHLMCPMRTESCRHQGLSQVEQPRSAMGCHSAASVPKDLKLKMEPSKCCTLSSQPQSPASSVSTKLSTNTLRAEREDKTSISALILHDIALDQRFFSVVTIAIPLDHRNTYLRTSTLLL